MGHERENKILLPNSVHSRPELKKFQKKKEKKIQKIKKVISGIISIQNGLRETEKERKEI